MTTPPGNLPPPPQAAQDEHGAVRTMLALVRHGQAESNRDLRFGGHSAAALTALGRRQAEATAAALADFGATALVSSDLARAAETAAPIARVTGLPIALDPGLRERSLGVFDGLSFAEAEARYPEHWARLVGRDHAAVPPGGELVDSVHARVSEAIDRIVTANAGGRVIVVSHGLAIFHAFAHITGLGSPSGDLRVFVLVDNCSITRLEHRAARWRIYGMNEVAHLRDVAKED
jgi:probable phosphoglycerate mutase